MAQKMRSLMSLIDAACNELPVEEAFLIDLKATVSQLNPPYKPSTYYKPSSLGCMRVMYFNKIGADVDNTPADYSGQRICETGTDSHERIQDYVSKMKDCNFDCQYIDVEEYVKMKGLDYLEIRGKKGFETKLYDKRYNLSFLCDGIIKYKGIYYILEIKTETSDKGFNRKAVNPDHILQATSYSLSLGIRKVLFLYEERDFCSPKTFLLTITDDMLSSLIMRIETVDQAVKDLVPPAKPASLKGCYYCCYKGVCKQYK